MRILVKELTAEPLDLREVKPFEWLNDALAGTQGRPAPLSGLDVALEASAYSGNVFVHGSMRASVLLTCSRCAAEWLEPTVFPFDLVLAPARAQSAPREDIELTRDDVQFTYYEGEVIELDDALREQVILQLPEYPLCQPDCKGLCQRCGGNRNEGKCTCPPEAGESAFARLKDIKL
jgi:uncharacterized protein